MAGRNAGEMIDLVKDNKASPHPFLMHRYFPLNPSLVAYNELGTVRLLRSATQHLRHLVKAHGGLRRFWTHLPSDADTADSIWRDVVHLLI
jgi:hypothetical protein